MERTSKDWSIGGALVWCGFQYQAHKTLWNGLRFLKPFSGCIGTAQFVLQLKYADASDATRSGMRQEMYAIYVRDLRGNERIDVKALAIDVPDSETASHLVHSIATSYPVHFADPLAAGY